MPSPILDAVAPEPGDIVLNKLRWDAFHFTELEPILRNLGVRRLIVAGLQTNVCVESTVRSAMMRNFEVAVPEDAVSTDGEALHFNALNAMRVLYVSRAMAGAGGARCQLDGPLPLRATDDPESTARIVSQCCKHVPGLTQRRAQGAEAVDVDDCLRQSPPASWGGLCRGRSPRSPGARTYPRNLSA